MIDNFTTLFENDQMVVRRNLQNRDCKAFLSENGGEIIRAFDEAFELTMREKSQKPLSFVGRNWFPIVMNGNLIGCLGRVFPENRKTLGQRVVFRFPNRFILLVKKLDDKFRPSNINTRFNQMIQDQLSLDGMDIEPLLYLGYRVNRTMDKLLGIYIVYRFGRGNEWVINLSDVVEVQPQQQNVVPEFEREPLVKIKKELQKKQSLK